MSKMIVIGRIGRPYGIKGWMRLISYTQPIENIQSYTQWHIQINHQWQSLDRENIQIKFNPKGYFHIKFVDCNTPEQASLYNHALIAVDREEFPELAKGEYYWSDLEGLVVMNKAGIVLGKVSHLFSTGANDVLVVKGDRERLIPYTEDVVLEVDLPKGEISVDWDETF
jgi:16S rRNA processing protein RimM